MLQLLKQMDTGSEQSRRKAEEEQQCREAFSIWLLLNNSIPVPVSVEQVRLHLYMWEKRSVWPFDLPPQQCKSAWASKQKPRLSVCT